MRTIISAALACLLASAALPATAAHQHSRAEIEMLRRSADALQSVDAQLADWLRRHAVLEAAEHPGVEALEGAEPWGEEEVSRLRRAADYLVTSHPDLAAELRRFADFEAREHRAAP